MTPAMMSPETRKAFANLPPLAREEFQAWLRNRFQILVGTNDLEAHDERLNALIRGYAKQRNRAVDIAMDELLEIFGPIRDAEYQEGREEHERRLPNGSR